MTHATTAEASPITQTDGGRDVEIAKAITALTAAAKATYPTPSGEQRYDFGEIACHVLAATAANLGGVETLLAGRSGSWEADYLRQLLLATVGHDERYLIEHRTEPVRLLLDPAAVFADFGLEEMMDDELDPLYAIPEGDTRSHDEVDRDGELGDKIQDLYKADQSAYLAAYTQTVRRVAAQRGLRVPVEVERNDSLLYEQRSDDELAEQLDDAARDRTPVPATGQAPRDHPETLPADAARATGRTYRARIQGGAA